MSDEHKEKINQAEKMYKKGSTFKDIAEKIGVNENTVKSWAKRNSWNREKVAKKLQKKLFESVDSNAELTEKQKLFCVFYVQSFNATQAYLKAFGGSKKVAGVSGHELLKNPKIQAEISKLKAEMRKYFDVGFEDYINYLLKVVGAKVSDFVNFGNRKGKNFIELADADSIDDSAIIELKQVKGEVFIKLEDRKWAWEKLAKIFGFGENLNDSDLPVVLIDNLRGKADES